MSNDLAIREGVVSERIEGGRVRVTVLDGSDCEGCEGSCGDDEGLFTDSTFEVTAIDDLGAEKGDVVRLEIEPRSFGKLSAIVFGIPAVMLLGGLGIGTLLSSVLVSGSYSTALQGGTAAFLFLTSLGGLKLYDSYLAANTPTRAEIKELLSKDCQFGGLAG